MWRLHVVTYSYDPDHLTFCSASDACCTRHISCPSLLPSFRLRTLSLFCVVQFLVLIRSFSFAFVAFLIVVKNGWMRIWRAVQTAIRAILLSQMSLHFLSSLYSTTLGSASFWEAGSGSASKWKAGSGSASKWRAGFGSKWKFGSLGKSKSGKVSGRILILIRIHIKLNGRIRIHIKMKSRIRIRIADPQNCLSLVSTKPPVSLRIHSFLYPDSRFYFHLSL